MIDFAGQFSSMLYSTKSIAADTHAQSHTEMGLHDDLLRPQQGAGHVDVDTDTEDASDRDRRPSIQGDVREKGPAPCTLNARSVAATLALTLTLSLHIGYAFGHGPACAGQIFQSMLEGQRDLLRLFCLTSVFLGAAVGAAFGGWLGDRIGRRWALVVSSAAPIAGWAMWSEARAPMHLTLGMLISGRIFVGIGSGMASVLVPVLIAELVPARLRGALVCFHQLGIGAGFTVAYGVGWNSVDAATVAEARTCIACGWRLAGLIGIIPAGLGGVLAAFAIPESPRWLIRHGAACKGLADASLRTMRGPNQQRLVVAELAALEKSALITTAPGYTWRHASLATRFVLAAAVVVSTHVGGELKRSF
jgi:MFS family permease